MFEFEDAIRCRRDCSEQLDRVDRRETHTAFEAWIRHLSRDDPATLQHHFDMPDVFGYYKLFLERLVARLSYRQAHLAAWKEQAGDTVRVSFSALQTPENVLFEIRIHFDVRLRERLSPLVTHLDDNVLKLRRRQFDDKLSCATL